MKSFFSRAVNLWKTRRLPRADVDCSDLVLAEPNPPSVARLRQVVQERRQSLQSPPSSTAELLQREVSLRSTVFDLHYRCGAAGRCVEGRCGCRFPKCFAMRPVTKGAEVLAERLAYEVDDAPSPQTRELVRLAQEEALDDVVKGIRQLVDSHIRAAASGRVLHATLQLQEENSGGDNNSEIRPAAVRSGSESAEEGVNPLMESEQLREEVISLYLWRAALLVNMRADERGVCSLLNLATLVPQQDRVRLYTAAARWAALNDMEVIYYRALLQQYETFQTAVSFAHDRPLLLQRVMTACGVEDAYFVECATHVVFAKEVTATVSRAQSAQAHGDLTEDPMKSLCIPLAMRYYRFHVSDAFWDHFLRLLCMPPVPPPESEEERARDAAEQLGLTPNYVLDAVGRSILLHHLVMFNEGREREIASGAVAETVRLLKNEAVREAAAAAAGGGVSEGEFVVHPSHYEHVLSERERGIAVTRLRELLLVARTYESAARNLTSGEEMDAREGAHPELAASSPVVSSPGGSGSAGDDEPPSAAAKSG